MIPLHRLQPLICDPYRISTVYSYWKNQKGSKGAKNENAVFELYTGACQCGSPDIHHLEI